MSEAESPDACGCRAGVNEKLAEHGQELVTDLFNPGRLYVETEWLGPKPRGKKKLWMEATCCPFCGVKYPERPKRA